MKMIEHPAAQALAAEQASLGLELAFRANAAFDSANDLNARREAVLREGLHRPDYIENVLFAQDGPRAEVEAHRANHRQFADAAGALIGRYTLGGEFLSTQNGNEPILSYDGSYTSGSAH